MKYPWEKKLSLNLMKALELTDSLQEIQVIVGKLKDIIRKHSFRI